MMSFRDSVHIKLYSTSYDDGEANPSNDQGVEMTVEASTKGKQRCQPLLLCTIAIMRRAHTFGVVMQCHNLFQIAESLSLFQSLVSMWCRCMKTGTKDLSCSTMYVACTFYVRECTLHGVPLLYTAFH